MIIFCKDQVFAESSAIKLNKEKNKNEAQHIF